ncbi:hypothetical protein BT93_A1569 [Corymbia citriodora subsp. variegata]|nr:hypothetical protein BT93_A1569 [Corymbia citriodora subsp. variegata]
MVARISRESHPANQKAEPFRGPANGLRQGEELQGSGKIFANPTKIKASKPQIYLLFILRGEYSSSVALINALPFELYGREREREREGLMETGSLACPERSM